MEFVALMIHSQPSSRKQSVLLWDVGGTLVEPARSETDAVRMRLEACGVEHARISDSDIKQSIEIFLLDERNWRTIAQERAAERQWLAHLLAGLIASEHELVRLVADLPRYFDLYRPVPGIEELLADLRGRGYRMAIVSNWPPSLPEFLAHHRLDRYFDRVVFSAENGIHKPEASIFQRALASLNANAEQAILIGDNPQLDIAPARAMGMRTIHFDPRCKSQASDASNTETLRQILECLMG